MDDFDFEQDLFQHVGGQNAVPELDDVREARAVHREEERQNRQRSSHASKREEDRVKYTLSLADAVDGPDNRAILKQTILCVSHLDLKNALDYMRLVRQPIPGIKKGNLAGTMEMVANYAEMLYGVGKKITELYEVPKDAEFWKSLNLVHSLIDGFIERGHGRTELFAAIDKLPELVRRFAIEGEPLNELALDARPMPVDAMKAVDSVGRRVQIAPAEISQAPVMRPVKALAESVHSAAKKKGEAEIAMMSRELMPDGNTEVYNLLMQLREALKDPATLKAETKAKKSVKRDREEKV